MTQNELAKLMRLEKATITSLLMRMEEADLIERSISRLDRRARVVRLSASAKQLVSRIHELGEQVVRRGRAGISAADRRIAISVLQRLAQNLTEMEEAAETELVEELED
jgi:DNA-binding MarR family transcriptional regulator